MCQLSGAFSELVQDLNLFKRLQNDPTKDTPINELEDYLYRCNNLKDGLVRIQDALEQTSVSALSEGKPESFSDS